MNMNTGKRFMRIIKRDLKLYIYKNKDWCIDWHKNSKRHREDGSAVIWSDGDEYYLLNGKNYFKDNYWKQIHANY